MRRRTRLDGGADSLGEGAGQFPLEGKSVIGRAVEGDRPKPVAVVGAVELSGDAQAAGIFLDATLEHCGDAQLFADAVEIASLVLELEGGSVGRHAQAGDARQAIDDFAGDGVAEPIMAVVVGQVEEGQNRDGTDLGAGCARVPPGTGGGEGSENGNSGQNPEPAAATRRCAGRMDGTAGRVNGGRTDAHAGVSQRFLQLAGSVSGGSGIRWWPRKISANAARISS